MKRTVLNYEENIKNSKHPIVVIMPQANQATLRFAESNIVCSHDINLWEKDAFCFRLCVIYF